MGATVWHPTRLKEHTHTSCENDDFKLKAAESSLYRLYSSYMSALLFSNVIFLSCFFTALSRICSIRLLQRECYSHITQILQIKTVSSRMIFKQRTSKEWMSRLDRDSYGNVCSQIHVRMSKPHVRKAIIDKRISYNKVKQHRQTGKLRDFATKQ